MALTSRALPETRWSEFDARPGTPESHAANVVSEVARCRALAESLGDATRAPRVARLAASTDRPQVSVILPMYNAAPWITTALRSLMVQQAPIEILAIDDASTDETYDLAVREAASDTRVHLLRLHENVGAYQIRNWAASRLARGDWLSFQDADDLSHPNRFSLQLQHAARNGSMACGTFVHHFFPPEIPPRHSNTRIVQADGQGHAIAFYPDTPRARSAQPIRQLLQAYPQYVCPQTGKPAGCCEENQSLAFYPTLMLRRELFLDLGGFEGRIRAGADRTFARRLIRLHGITQVPAIAYSRRIHHQSLTQNPATGYESEARKAHFRAFDELEKAMCTAIRDQDEAQLKNCCRSDLYCPDVRVAQVHSGHWTADQLGD